MEISTKFSSSFSIFTSKSIMYASFVAFAFVVVFGWMLLDRTEIIDFWFFSLKQNNTPNGVYADYIAKVVEFNWAYSLVRDWLVVKSENLKMIQDGDVVTLPWWTDLIFTLEDWTQAKIVWPAEFSVTKTEKWYQISLFDGKFFRIYCPGCSSDVEIITPEFSISQEKDQTLDIHIAKEDDGELLVKNDGDKVLVTTRDNDNKNQTKLDSTNVITIASNSANVNFLDDDVDVMSVFMAKNNISATFTLSTGAVEWPTIPSEIKPEKVIAMQTNKTSNNTKIEDSQIDTGLDTDTVVLDPLLDGIIEVIISNDSITWAVDTSISAELWIPEDEQQVPTVEQMQSLRSSLNSFFLMNLFESIYKQDKPEENISRIADRINAIAIAFGYSDRADADLSSIKNTTLSIKWKLEKDRYISPSYIFQLEKLAKRCDELQNPSSDDRDVLNSNLPLYLRLM